MWLNPTGLAFLALASSCAAIAGFLTYQQIGEVNRKLPDNEQISYLFMYPEKMRRLKADYKRLYPKGRVNFWRSLFQAAMFFFLALSAIASGFLK